MKRLLATIFLVCVFLLAGCGLFSDPDERVVFPPEPDSREYQYVDLAQHIASEKPCYLISRDSVSVAPLNAPGTRANKIRSHCFSTVAQRTARPELCEHVVSVSTLLYAGHANDRARCVQEASRERAPAGVGMIDHDSMFELAGFSQDKVVELMHSYRLPANGRYCLIFSPDFFEAIERMPRFSNADDLESMKQLQWKPHPFLALQGFPCTGKFTDTERPATESPPVIAQ